MSAYVTRGVDCNIGGVTDLPDEPCAPHETETHLEAVENEILDPLKQVTE